jgi:DNA-binding IclR family transcriptional regulator
MDYSVRVSGVGVVDKSALVLRLLSDGRRRNLAELQEGTGLPRATVHRLANALLVHRLLSYRPDEGWGLGPWLVELARQASSATDLTEVAAPALEELRTATGESVQLYVRDENERLCVMSLDSTHELRTIVPVGARLPLTVGSAGKVLSGSTRKWVESVEERASGVASVSAPVMRSGEVVAAVSVSGPVGRTTRSPGRRYSKHVVAAARRIEQDAGWLA